MTDTTTTTTATPAVDSKQIRALVKAVGTLHDSVQSQSTAMFTNIVNELAEHVSAITDLYAPMNEAWRKGKKNPEDMSFRRFFDGVSAACKLVNVTIPDSKETRLLFVFARQGNTKAAQNHFLRTAAVSGDFSISLAEYVRFLGVRTNYDDKGKLTDAAAKAKAKAEAEATRQEAIRKAARTSRPVHYDWLTVLTQAERDDPKAMLERLRLLHQDLGVFITDQTNGLVKNGTLKTAQVNQVDKAVERAIKAHAIA